MEARLLEFPGVREAVVLAREDAPGTGSPSRRLVAYVTGADLQPEALRARLKSQLPEYMVPAAYVQLGALPLTPNGKLDRKALPAPEGSAFAMVEYEAPQGELESALAAIWGELLGHEQVGRADDFFELGGHSLLAVQMTSRIRAQLGMEVALAELFSQPRLAGFAKAVGAASASTLPAIVPADRSKALPLSFAQQRLWFLDQLDERTGAAYLMPGGVRLLGLLGLLDEGALVRALDRIVARHEVLRTSLVKHSDGGAVQMIAAADIGLPLGRLDLSTAQDPQATVRALASEEASTPFDLERAPLIRGRLLRLGAQEHVLLLTLHHIVSDGWSMSVLIEELGALYAAFSRSLPDPLPALKIQYAPTTPHGSGTA